MNYFGCLKETDLNALSDREKIELFVSKGLYKTIPKLNITFNAEVYTTDESNYQTICEPVQELTSAYYKFILNNYHEQIDAVFLDFFHLFNNEILTLETKKSKKIARQHYLYIVYGNQSPKFDLVGMSQNQKGIQKVRNTPKLELFSIKQYVLKTRAISEYLNGLVCYLLGDAEHFNNELANEIEILEEIIRFEGDFKILSTLNEEYKFENLETEPTDKGEGEGSVTNETVSLPLPHKKESTLTMPSEEDMDNYLLEYVFSKKR